MDDVYNPYLDPEVDLLVKTTRLPHWHQDSKIQFVTYRLADSLPVGYHKMIIDDLMLKLPHDISAQNVCRINAAYHKRVNSLLDNGYGRCLLRQRAVCEAVLESLYHFDDKRYDLLGYVVMPNHVHLLIHLFPEVKLNQVMHSHKSYTSHVICKIMPIEDNKFWMEDYFDRMVRDKHHLYNCIRYIETNFRHGGVAIGGRFFDAK